MPVLQALGVNAEAEAVYRTMLAEHTSCVEEIAALLRLPEERVRRRLDELAELSLLRPSWDVPGTVRPISPDVALGALVARQQAEIARQQQLVEQSRAEMAAFVAQFTAEGRTSTASVEELIGLDGVRLKLQQLCDRARFELVSFQPGRQSQEARDACRPSDESMLARGLQMRDVYMDSVRNDQPTMAYISWLAERGAEARAVPTLPMRMIVYDREVAVIPIDPQCSRKGALLTRSRGAVTALVALFEHVWQQAAPLQQPPVVPADKPTAQERELLRMLTVGAKDESAARALGVSVRTVRRMVAELTERLGATSRFQAGVHAAREGWV